ncbi:MAG: 2Fe-2S iron-sulfur cluster binding domain-containing protein [Betaproteobacteria bacterium]|nr:2Fe-2S iron-sulfur cluster binding domain-containing protein [Betaproteobacteria bacterium]
MAIQFHPLRVKRVSPEAANSVAITFAIPPEKKDLFQFQPGQFLTLRAQLNGQDVRRNYSISSPRSRFIRGNELEIGIRPVEEGVFSNWAVNHIKAGDTIEVMPPDGRFTVKKDRAIHRVGFASGSGITPILSIAATTLEEQPESKFTLIYGNRRMSSVMFNESLQDLKDRFPGRFTMIHTLSRQAQEVELQEGRIDGDKVRQVIKALLPVASMDEVFICGPESMIEATQQALVEAGVPESRVYFERFTTSREQAEKVQSDTDTAPVRTAANKDILLKVIVDGHEHELRIGKDEKLLDAAMNAGLDVPFSCKAGVCCTCRGRILEGSATMHKNYTLEKDEVEKGYVLTCQATATSPQVILTFDDR